MAGWGLLVQSNSYWAWLVFVSPGNTIRATSSTVGQKPLNRDRTPASAQLSLVAPAQLESELSIDCVVSRTIITSTGCDFPPLAPAAAVAEILIEPMPSTAPR